MPDVPVTVTANTPNAAFGVAERVIVVKSFFVVNAALTPGGKPAAVKATGSVKPCNGVTLIEAGALLP